MDLILIERNGYSILDLLSDIGGLQRALFSGVTIFLSIVNQNQLNDYLASKLFKSDQTPLTAFSRCERIRGFIGRCLPRRLVSFRIK